MDVTTGAGIPPELVFALVGVLGVGAQWIAWRIGMPAIVLMLVTGLAVGPGLGLLVPHRDIGSILEPLIAVAVAIILFEGGLTLDRKRLADAAAGVRRLVIAGAPLGWALSAAALHWVAGLSWATSAVFGGILIVTGPTVIAPLLRQAHLARRPSLLLQWEAILNDPLGALAAVLAWQVVLVHEAGLTPGAAAYQLALGVVVAGIMGGGAGWGLVTAFRRAQVPEFMKVPVLFTGVLAVFALSDAVLAESGLLAVTIMGIVFANSGLASFEEIRRFKEHATILLVSGVFILLAADMDVERLALLDWRAAAFVAATILLVRPLTVLLSLAGSGIPLREQILVALTGPRGVVLVAVAGFFGEKLVSVGVADGAIVTPLAFALVAATVVVHGFSLKPLARLLRLASAEQPGLLIVGGSRFATALGQAMQRAGVPVLVADPNWSNLRRPREAGLRTFWGDILSEAAEHGVELVAFEAVLAATDNDAYNTLVATDLGPEMGRENVWQLQRESDTPRRTLPATLGGQPLGEGAGFGALESRIAQGWQVSVTRLSEEFGLDDWREANPEAVLIGRLP
ncbi:MAG: sodium:proton antiporter, partial [Deinococcus-Thermus bacterium]|nr:sodium:proton antiporter [Deinococcota bacterium]